jgi:hypothetical protein
MILWKLSFILLGLHLFAKADEGGKCTGGNCPSVLPVTLPPQQKCDCERTHSRGCRTTTQTTTLSPSLTSITTTVPSTESSTTSCPIFTTTTDFETTVESFTITTVVTLPDSTTTRLSTITTITSTTTTRRPTCHTRSSHHHTRTRDHDRCFRCKQESCGGECEHGFKRCFHGCPVVSHCDRLVHVLPTRTQECVSCVPVSINPSGVPPVVPMCPACPALPTVTITPSNFVITIIAHGPSSTSLNTSCLTA